VLRLPLGAEALPLVMLVLGLATQEMIAKMTGLAADLRWPNDVLLGGRKCAGILAQLEGGVVIAGIGINVSHARFPPEIEDLATSLHLEGAGAVSREDLLIALIRAVDDCCRILTKEGAAAILKMFSRASSYARGRRVRIEQEVPSSKASRAGSILAASCGSARRMERRPPFWQAVCGQFNFYAACARCRKHQRHHRRLRRQELTGRWRLRTIREQTADEWASCCATCSRSPRSTWARSMAWSSRAWSRRRSTLTAMAERYFHREPMFVSYATDLELRSVTTTRAKSEPTGW